MNQPETETEIVTQVPLLDLKVQYASLRSEIEAVLREVCDYILPLHLQECFRQLDYQEDDLPNSKATSRSVLSIPVFPELSVAQMDYVANSIGDYLTR